MNACLLMKEAGGEEAARITLCFEEPYQAGLTPCHRACTLPLSHVFAPDCLGKCIQ